VCKIEAGGTALFIGEERLWERERRMSAERCLQVINDLCDILSQYCDTLQPGRALRALFPIKRWHWTLQFLSQPLI